MVEVKLHDIGEGMTEGEILAYFVQEGDHVKVDQPLVEVSTDKMVAELTSPAAGIVKKIAIEVGTVITVGTTVIEIEEEGNSATAAPKQEEAENIKVQEQTKTNVVIEKSNNTSGKNRVLAAPFTRKIARDHNVDIERIEGSGPAGRVTEQDVYNFINQGNKPTISQGESVKEEVVKASPVQEIHENKDPDVIPFKGRRKQIAKKMVQSLYTIPHVTHFEEADLTELIEYRKELKALGENISVAAFFIKALVITLKDFPIFNSKLDEENEVIKLEKNYNIGIATDSEDGLIVPVIHHADQKSLREIHNEMKALTKKAQNNELTMKEMTGSTFTISNVGPLGSIGATPIINYPEAALIAFHKTKKMPVVNENDEIVIRSMMNMSMAFDHRVADGGSAVAFTNRFKALIENPKMLMLELK